MTNCKIIKFPDKGITILTCPECFGEFFKLEQYEQDKKFHPVCVDCGTTLREKVEK